MHNFPHQPRNSPAILILLYRSNTSFFFLKFGGSEAIITAISDEFPIIKRHRQIAVACLFSFYFLIGLGSCTQVYVLL